MTGLRFLHASDLHLGRSFSALPEREGTGLRGRLTAARHATLATLAQIASDQNTPHILLAGDTFDSATPSEPVWRQALTAMAEATHVTWWLLPGNHDNLRDAEPLWDNLTAHAPTNLRLLRQATPVEMGPGVTLLPAPVTFRDPGRDLTEDLAAMPSPEGHIRLGLAHGGVVDFEETGSHIAPDRDRSAGLDYLALGDWHGRKAIGPRTHYPGTVEQDRFRHNRRGLCLAVHIAGSGAVPEIAEIETGQFLWQDLTLDLVPDAAPTLALPQTHRRDTLLRVTAQGRTTLTGATGLRQHAQAAAPDFAHFELRDTDLIIDPEAATDLDAIDPSAEGALRQAAERLLTDGADPVSAAALRRLFALATEDRS